MVEPPADGLDEVEVTVVLGPVGGTPVTVLVALADDADDEEDADVLETPVLVGAPDAAGVLLVTDVLLDAVVVVCFELPPQPAISRPTTSAISSQRSATPNNDCAECLTHSPRTRVISPGEGMQYASLRG